MKSHRLPSTIGYVLARYKFGGGIWVSEASHIPALLDECDSTEPTKLARVVDERFLFDLFLNPFVFFFPNSKGIT